MNSTNQTYHRTQSNLGPVLVLRGSLIMAFLFVIVFSWLSSGVARAEGSLDQPIVSATAIATAEATENSDPPKKEGTSCKVSQAFPEKVRRWCEWINQYARSQDLPPDLIAALIWQESGGDPSAYSHSGAVGLMQVMPRDGIAASFVCQNGPCFASRPTIAELEDPEFNISYGTRMLAGLYQRFGDLRQALKAYGPMDVGFSYADTVLQLYEDHR